MNLNSPLLEIKDLQVSINDNEILKKFKFNLKKVKFMQLWDQMVQEKVHFQKFCRSSSLFCFKW
jgi:hypothetical protein